MWLAQRPPTPIIATRIPTSFLIDHNFWLNSCVIFFCLFRSPFCHFVHAPSNVFGIWWAPDELDEWMSRKELSQRCDHSSGFQAQYCIYFKGRFTKVQFIYSLLSPVQLFVALWTVARQAPLSMGFLSQEYWSGLPFPSPGESFQSRDRTQVCIGGWVLCHLSHQEAIHFFYCWVLFHYMDVLQIFYSFINICVYF